MKKGGAEGRRTRERGAEGRRIMEGRAEGCQGVAEERMQVRKGVGTR